MKYYWVRIYDYKVDDELKEFTDDNVWDAQKALFLMNITVPKITLEDLAKEYSKIVSGQLSIETDESEVV